MECSIHQNWLFVTEQKQMEEIRGDVPDLNFKTVKIAFHFYFYFKTHPRKGIM